ncbi:MAG: 2-oxo acid dehydrogenase subunit E2 [Candidatus Aenigmarchaeota archaeon]|nr:2-oxo acid dehydrogenase subunit E2 [Candidatus Aenigmarchaeota archaeon]
MAFDFVFPDVGEGIAEGEIVTWRVKEGDRIKKDQVVAEVETDKAVVEIPSPREGVILRLSHKEGDTVKVGEVLLTIGEKGEAMGSPAELAPPPLPAAPRPPTVADRPAVAPAREAFGVVGDIPDHIELPGLTKHIEQVVEQKLQGREILPAVRRLARDLGADLGQVTGTGEGGRVTEQDVRTAARAGQLASPQAAARVVKKYDFWGYVDRVPLKGLRKATADHLTEGVRASAYVTHMDEADVSELAALRERENAKAKAHLTWMPFVVQAVCRALKKHPQVNAALDEEHGELLLKKYYNIGIAVDVEEGLIVPVIKGADQKSLSLLAKEIQQAAEQAKGRQLDLADLKGGTFTITNVGALGGMWATPLPNHPEAAILATGRVLDRVRILKGVIQERKVLPLSLTFDHRILDGAEAARFVNDVKAYLEDPDLLLVE